MLGYWVWLGGAVLSFRFLAGALYRMDKSEPGFAVFGGLVGALAWFVIVPVLALAWVYDRWPDTPPGWSSGWSFTSHAKSVRRSGAAACLT